MITLTRTNVFKETNTYKIKVDTQFINDLNNVLEDNGYDGDITEKWILDNWEDIMYGDYNACKEGVVKDFIDSCLDYHDNGCINEEEVNYDMREEAK